MACSTKKDSGLWALAFAVVFGLFAILISVQTLWMGRIINIFGFVSENCTSTVSTIPFGNYMFPIYNFMMLLGMVAICIICVLKREEMGLKVWQGILTGVIMAVFGYIGGRILYTIENIREVMKSGIGFGGVSFYGAVFFIPLGVMLMAKMFKKDVQAYMDYCIQSGITMLSFIRIGCFMQGCCHGITLRINGLEWMIPVQLIEASLDFLLLFVIIRMAYRGILKNYLYVVGTAGYGAIRFVLEYIRVNPKIFLGMTEGQLLSLICIANLVLLLIFKDKIEAKRKAKTNES